MDKNDKIPGIKNLGDNKMVSYGRGGAAIALQVKAETGSPKSIEELTVELSEAVTAWKTVTYPTAWAYMLECGQKVYDPGYIVNPWGRRRHFVNINEKRADLERQAFNYPIQSTVADTMGIALKRIVDYRALHGLSFTIPNQIHDALMLNAPISEIEESKEALRQAMGGIPIPVGGRIGTMTLAVDVEVHPERWGEEQKD